MSKYYGTLRGSAKNIATRRGTAASGITASVQSWHGSVTMHLEDGIDETTKPRITILIDSEGSSTNGTIEFFGTIEELKGALNGD